MAPIQGTVYVTILAGRHGGLLLPGKRIQRRVSRLLRLSAFGTNCRAGSPVWTTSLIEGAIVEKSVLPFRSFVQEPMRYGRMLLTGDAAHTVPSTGAKGLNLALADVRVLADALEKAVLHQDRDALDRYGDRALARVWKAQHFSYWMTCMLHAHDQSAEFDAARQLGELRSVVESEAGSRYLAEGYTGWSTTSRTT